MMPIATKIHTFSEGRRDVSADRGRRPEPTRFASGAKRTSQIRNYFASFRSRVRLLSWEFLCTSRLRPGTPRANIRPVPGTATLGSEFWEVSELENLSSENDLPV